MAAGRRLLLVGVIACLCTVAMTTFEGFNQNDIENDNHNRERRAIGDCGGTFTSNSGQFSSPGYPGNYDNYEYCQYDITVPTGYVILLEFIEFNIESGYDKVKIYGESPFSTLTHEYSGSSIPPPFQSSSPSIRVTFTSDSFNVMSGFLASYSATEYEYSIGLCGGVLSSDTGTIASPSYPSSYPSSQDCYYSITVSEGNTITLEFTLFDTEECCDRVEIFDGDSRYATSMGEYSGTRIDSPFISSGRSLYIHFHSDSSVSDTGFYASYWLSSGDSGGGGSGGTTEYSVCDDPFATTNGGFIQSPSYPLAYPNDRHCSITVSTSGVFDYVYLRFLDVDLYEGSYGSCSTGGDYVTIVDSSMVTMGTVCSNSDIGNEYTSSNTITLNFYSGSYHPADNKGFQAIYSFYYESWGASCFYSDNHFHCSDEYRCISGSLKCDGYDHCGDNSDEECSNVGLIVGIVVGVLAFIVIVAIVVYCCCKKSSATTPSGGATNAELRRAPRTETVSFTANKPNAINTVSTPANDLSYPGNNAYGGYYQPTAPSYMNEYNSPSSYGLSGGYPPPPPTAGTATIGSSYPPPPLPGTMTDPAYPPTYPPPPQEIGAPAPSTYDAMYPPGSNSNMPPPPSYDAAIDMGSRRPTQP